ncbi:MAG: hypothetical protein ACI4RR_08955 [Eubacterium sp.]
MKMRRTVSIVVFIIFMVSVFASFPIEVEANNNVFTASYSGTYDSSTPMEFDIYNVDLSNNTFSGHIKINHQLVTINKDISGTITLYSDYYVCSFGFSFYWFITTYDAVFTIKIDPFNGVATGDGGGGILIYSDEILMNTTVNKFYNKTLSYCEDDMKMCMDLSNAI